ncbi:DNA-directed DNA polymerase [Suillus subluteus]|nr:DNA-directed DNA polymerase [Suillus subluteus]
MSPVPSLLLYRSRGFDESDINAFGDQLNKQVQDNFVRQTEIIKRRSLWGYRGDDWIPFMKLTISEPRNLPKIRDDGASVGFETFPTGQPYSTFESNIAYTLRFMIDTKVVGMNWIEIPAGQYKLVSEKDKKSTCQIELKVRWDTFISHPPEENWQKFAPLRILSFDIECAGRKGIFPETQVDPLIQIANMVTRQGETKPFIRNIFTLNTCSHIVGSQVMSFDDEAEMLRAWRDFIEEVDPDLVIGYNIANFGVPYLMDRAKHLKANKFPSLGRMKGSKTQTKETHFSSKAYGQRDSENTELEGRDQRSGSYIKSKSQARRSCKYGSHDWTQCQRCQGSLHQAFVGL